MTDLADLPTGTVTFLFTDLEGSAALLEAHPAAYRDAVRRHHALLRGAVEGHGGAVFETVGGALPGHRRATRGPWRPPNGAATGGCTGRGSRGS